MSAQKPTINLDIPGYKIIDQLGIGAMAKVYLAIQETLDRKVALKVMSESLLSDPEFRERFLREAKIVAQLSHANIVSVYDVGVHNDNYYLAMQYHNGGDLKTKIKNGISIFDAITFATQIASALDFAHAEGYVHRDVKPENILFDRNNNAILTDFGIAVSGEAKSKMTAAGMVVGTPKYMSPEQATGKKVDGRSDLYSLGVIIYEMLTGHPPYVADNPVAVCQMHVANPVPKLPEEISAFQNIIDACMAKDPDDRVDSGKDIVALLTEAEKNNEILASRDETMVRISRDLIQNVDFDGNDKTEVSASGQKRKPASEQKTTRMPTTETPATKTSQNQAAQNKTSNTDVIAGTSASQSQESGLKKAWAGIAAFAVVLVAVVAVVTYLVTKPKSPAVEAASGSGQETEQITDNSGSQPVEQSPVVSDAQPSTSKQPVQTALVSGANLLRSVSIISPKTLSLCGTKEPYLMGKKVISDQDSLNQGDCFSIQLEAAKKVDLAVYSHSEDGTIYRLLPNECNAMGIDGVDIDPDKTINFPVSGNNNLGVIGLDSKAGREWVYTIATTDAEARQQVLANMVEVPDVCSGVDRKMKVSDVQAKLKALSSRLSDRMQWISSSFQHTAI